MEDEEGSSDRLCSFAKKDYKVTAFLGRNGAMPVSVYTVLDTIAEPKLMQERGLTRRVTHTPVRCSARDS